MGKVSRFFDVAAQELPKATRWLWPFGLAALVYQYAVDSERGYTYIQPWWSSQVSEVPRYVLIASCIVMITLSLVSRRSEARLSKNRAWVSFGAWVSLLTVANLIVQWMHLPWASINTFASDGDGPSLLDRLSSVGIESLRLVADLRVWLVVALFAVVLDLHVRKYARNEDQKFVFANVRAPLWKSVAVSILVGVLVEAFPPFLTVANFAVGFSFPVMDTFFNFLFFDIGGVVDSVLILFSAIAIYAWMSGSRGIVDEKGIRLYIAQGAICFFSAKWEHVLHMKRVRSGSGDERVIVSVGRLPWYRVWLNLDASTESGTLGSRLAGMAESQGIRTSLVTVGRNAKIVGILSLVLCVSLAVAFSLALTWDLQRLVELLPERPDVFGERDFFVKYGLLSAASAACLGLGLGALFSRRDGSIRLVPLVGVAIAASMLPDAFVYWLVNIAIYAILMARLGPLEPQPWIPFPDVGSIEYAMWFCAYKGVFAVLGYFLAFAFLVKPWNSSLFAWPYRAKSRNVDGESCSKDSHVLVST